MFLSKYVKKFYFDAPDSEQYRNGWDRIFGNEAGNGNQNSRLAELAARESDPGDEHECK